MKQAHTDYLHSIGIAGGLLGRASFAISFWEQRLGVTVEDVFVSEYVLADGTHEYDSLFGFVSGFFMEAHSFTSTDDFDIGFLNKNVFLLDIKMTAYEEGAANQASRVEVSASLVPRYSGDFKATGANCDHLIRVVDRWLVPNLMDLSSAQSRSLSQSADDLL